MNYPDLSSRECSKKDYLISKEVGKLKVRKNILIGHIIFATLAFYVWVISMIIVNAAAWTMPFGVIFGSCCALGILPAFIIGGRIHKRAYKKIEEKLKDFGHGLNEFTQTDNIHG